MAVLAPAAAASLGGAGATAAGLGGAASLGAAAAGSGAALGSGLAAGAALGSGALPGMIGATLAGPGAVAGLGALPAAGGLFGGANLAALGGLSALPGAAATGLGSAGLAGTTAAMEPLKGAIISRAMETQAANLAAKNALMQQATTGANPLLGGAAQRGLPNTFSYLTETPSIANVPSMEVQRAADLSTGYGPSSGLRMPSGIAEGFKAKAPITPDTLVGQGPLPFRQALPSGIDPKANALSNAMNLIQNPSMQGAKDYAQEHPYVTSAAVGLGTKELLKGEDYKAPESDKGMIRPYTFESRQRPEAYAVSPLVDTSERRYFDDQFIAGTPYAADSEKAKKASGGIASSYAIGGPVETMAAMNAVGANTGYPMAGINTPMYANPMMQRPEAVNVLSPSGDAGVGAYSGEPKFADGGIANLGGYSDGGRLLKGPGDGVSDSIPAVIGKRQPARLADGEFVIPARIVSELGNGSTDAGARKLYKMMDRIQKGRRKSVGKDKVAVDSKAEKHLPA